MKLWLIAALVLLINIPCGMWRSRVRRYSIQWILAVHLPVPLIILMRIYSGLGWRWETFPVLVGAFFLGQFTGGRIQRIFGKSSD
ncbi:MAG: hypothetical protein ACOZB3_04275 [Calditrichota bacterium]